MLLLKMSALVAIAITTRTQQGGQTQWVYKDGPNKGYLCALLEQDGANVDVFLPAVTITTAMSSGNGLTALPWLHFPSKVDALDSVNRYCPVINQVIK